jgi:hypothetical protein
MTRLPDAADELPESGVPVVIYAARSKTDEDRNESAASQVEQILSRVAGRRIIGEPHIDYASGSKSNRGPGLAAATESATAEAERSGAAELWVYHSSRLGRGSGKPGQARAIGRLLYELQAAGVTVRSVTDDEFTANEMLWGFASRQAAKYSEDLSAHVKRGYIAAAARGTAAWLARGIRLGGYEVLKSFDDSGRVVHNAIKHPEDGWIYELIWQMARAGHSELSIQLELSARGARTRPARKDHQSRPFDINRISQILDNPAYAGLLVHNGEIVGAGRWPRYVEPEEFFRLRDERRERCHAAKRKPGRPPLGYLLSELASCGVCGRPMRAETSRRGLADGTRRRRYTCSAHRAYHPKSVEWCAATPVDAETADKLVFSGIDNLLTNADTLREQLSAGRTAEIERIGRIAETARQEVATAERVARKAQERYERALEDDDDDAADINLAAVRRKREDASRANDRLNAALDAINTAPAHDDQDVLARVWEALGGQVADAEGDIRKLNAALREWFDTFELRHTSGALEVVPVLSRSALARIWAAPERWPHGFHARAGGYDLDVHTEAGGPPVVRIPQSVVDDWNRLADLGVSPDDVFAADEAIRVGVNPPSTLRDDRNASSARSRLEKRFRPAAARSTGSGRSSARRSARWRGDG